MFAAEAIRRAGVELNGSVEISGTVDEESGGFAGVAWLAQHRRSERGPHRLRHHPGAAQRRSHLHRPSRRLLVRGRRRSGRIAHGSMPFLGVNAIEHMGVVLDRHATRAAAARSPARTTAVPVVPDAARGTRRSTSTASAAASRSTASRRRASPIAAARCSIGASCSRRASTRRRRRSSTLLDARRRATCPTSLRAPRSDGRAPGADAGRIAGRRRARARASHRVLGRSGGTRRQPRHLRSQARRRASPASRTASPTARASSIWRTSPTSGAASTIW